MGGFVLFRGNDADCLHRLLGLWNKKGFTRFSTFDVVGATLILFRKQTGSKVNWCESSTGSKLFASGSFVYKGLPYESGLKEMLHDLEGDGLDRESLYGAYSVIFSSQQRLSLRVDPSDLFHVFSNQDGTIISNSLQAVLVADGCRHRLNRDSLLEQLLTGSVAGPETLFSDITLLNRSRRAKFKSPLLEISDDRYQPSATEEVGLPFKETVESQLAELRNYFRQVKPLAGTAATSLGLSSGYDSRLLLLLAKDADYFLDVHTFSSRAHTEEERIALDVAKCAGLTIRPLEVQTWGELDQARLRANIDDAIYYYDGRTNMTMGSFDDVHTRRLRMTAIGQADLGLNGLGGELYRNREHLRQGRLNFNQWIRYFVMDPVCAQAITQKKIAEEFMDRMNQKYSSLMDVTNLKCFDRTLARRWYQKIWLPYSAGPKLCAENQISFSLMPFAEDKISSKALSITPHLGFGGRFEAALINLLDPAIAAIPSGYGHRFNKIPWSFQLKDAAIGCIPHSLRNLYATTRLKKALYRSNADSSRLDSLPEEMRTALQRLSRLDLPIRWDVLLSERAHQNRALYLACFFDRFREHIDFDGVA